MKSKTKKRAKVIPGWHRCRRVGHGLYMGDRCSICATEERRKANGECNASLWHGPGHQSRTYCQVKGPHKIHRAIYGCYNQEMEWKGKKAFTGYFDDPQELN